MKKSLILMTLAAIFIIAFFTISASAEPVWTWPFPTSNTVNSGFRTSDRPNHDGVDIGADIGAPIVAVNDGTIHSLYTGCTRYGGLSTGVNCKDAHVCSPNKGYCTVTGSLPYGYCNNGYGNGICLLTTDGYYVQFAHMQSVNPELHEGQYIKRGTVLGYVGGSGCATGKHCHYAVATINEFEGFINPMNITYGKPVQAQVDRGQDGIYCVGETVHITPSLTNLSSYSLKIIRTPTGGDTYVYWEGSISGTQFDLTLTEEGYYACCFTVSYYGQTVESDWVGWIVATPIKAQIDRGPGAVYNLGETVHITPDMTELDSYRLRIIRTPAGGEPYVDTYTYWEGNLQGPQYDLTLTEDGYYACCYLVTNNGQSIDSFGGWVGWTVLPREYMPDFLLPTGLTTIYSEAFAGINAEVVLVPDGCVSIASKAFANCPNLRYVIVDDLSKIDIAADALDGTNAEFIEKK